MNAHRRGKEKKETCFFVPRRFSARRFKKSSIGEQIVRVFFLPGHRPVKHARVRSSRREDETRDCVTRRASHLARRYFRPRLSLLTQHQQPYRLGHDRDHHHPERLRVALAAVEEEGDQGDVPSPKLPCVWIGTAASTPPSARRTALPLPATTATTAAAVQQPSRRPPFKQGGLMRVGFSGVQFTVLWCP